MNRTLLTERSHHRSHIVHCLLTWGLQGLWWYSCKLSWALLGPPRLHLWGLLDLGGVLLSSPGFSCALLWSPGATLGSPELSWAPLNSLGLPWALLGFPALSCALLGSPVGHFWEKWGYEDRQCNFSRKRLGCADRRGHISREKQGWTDRRGHFS